MSEDKDKSSSESTGAASGSAQTEGFKNPGQVSTRSTEPQSFTNPGKLSVHLKVTGLSKGSGKKQE